MLRRAGRAVPSVDSVSNPAQHSGPPVPVWLGLALAAFGGICMVASLALAYLVADHSSSDSSASSLVAIGLGSLGVLAVVLGAAVLGGAALARLWQRLRAKYRRG